MDWNDVFVYAAGIAVCGDSDYRYCFYCLEFQDVMGKDIGIWKVYLPYERTLLLFYMKKLKQYESGVK